MDKPVLIEIFAFVAGLFAVCAYVPSLLKIWKQRHAQNISLTLHYYVLASAVFMFVLGAAVQSISLMFWQGVLLSLVTAVIVLVRRLNAPNSKKES